MSMIRFNLITKEVTIEGTEPFVDGKFDEIRELMKASFKGAERRRMPTCPKGGGPILPLEDEEPGIAATTKDRPVRYGRKRRSDTRPAREASPDAVAQVPPVRRYILRKAGMPSAKDRVATLPQEHAGRVSIESLKEKLGVTEQQIIGILREAEKEGRVRRELDGSYFWV